jgi:hypothetical protein
MAHPRSAAPGVSYDLPDAERDRLTRQFLATVPGDHEHRFVCFELEGTDPYANIARQLEREVFFESWGNDAARMTEEFGPYEDASVFFLAIDVDASTAAGVLRMIRNSPAGLKTIVDLDDAEKSPIAPIAIPVETVLARHGIDDLDRCWDGATAAVPRRYRRKSPTIHMQVMLTVFAAAMRDDIEHFVAVLDGPVVKTARDVLGLPLCPLADTPPFTHMDAPDNQAVYAHIPSLLRVAADGNRRVGQKIRDCARRSDSRVFQLLSS